MVEGFCNCFSADFCFFSDFFAFLRSLRRLRAAARRFLRGLTAVFSTACNGASRQAAAAAAQRCTAGCTVQCQHTAPSSSAALIYQRARPPALAPAAKPQTSTAAAAKAAISRKKQRSAPSPSARRTASRTPASRQPSPRHHSTSPSTAHGAGDGAI